MSALTPTELAAEEAMARVKNGREILAMAQAAALTKTPNKVRLWEATAALRTLTTLHPGIGAVLRGEAVVVPMEATGAMLSSGGRRADDFMTERGPYPRTQAVYRAMLAASPYAPSAGGTA